MVASRVVTGVAEAIGVPEEVAILLGRGASMLVGTEMNGHHDVPAHHGDPSPTILQDSGPFAEFGRNQAG